MIIIFVLLWFSALWGMEKEMSGEEKPLWVPSLLNIAQHAVCSHILDKKITINDVQRLPAELHKPIEYMVIRNACCQIVDKKMSVKDAIQKWPPNILKRIESDYKPQVLIYKDIECYYLNTLTPDHRYMLVMGKQGLCRLDLTTQEQIVAADLKESICAKALSPSGSLVALGSCLNRIRIKDIAQNKVIADKELTHTNTMGIFPSFKYLEFLGERNLLLREENDRALGCIDIELKGYNHPNVKYIGILPATLEYIFYYKNMFCRVTLDGKIKNASVAKNLEELSPLNPVFSLLNPVIYESEMLIAYEPAEVGLVCGRGWIDIMSLKDWPTIVTPLTQLKYGKEEGIYISRLAFANKGQWLMGMKNIWRPGQRYGNLTIWDWKYNHSLYTFEDTGGTRHLELSYVDHFIPYHCLFTGCDRFCSFDPIKAVAATMLFQTTSQSITSTSHDNNSNNNNNKASNDNCP